jgi:hypothetical protein
VIRESGCFVFVFDQGLNYFRTAVSTLSDLPAVDSAGVLAICVVPRDVTTFSGVQKMNLEQFAFKAQHCGGGFVKF